MKYELLSNNRVFLCGTIQSNPVFSHESFGEAFYEMQLSVKRLSEQNDLIPIISPVLPIFQYCLV